MFIIIIIIIVFVFLNRLVWQRKQTHTHLSGAQIGVKMIWLTCKCLCFKCEQVYNIEDM